MTTIKRPQSIAELKEVPFFSKFTDEQLRAQCRRSAEGMEVLEKQARKTGKKAGGFTLEEIIEMKNHYLRLANE